MQYERVTLDMIGQGGNADDEPLVEQANEALQRVAEAVTDPKTRGKGTITIKIQVEEIDEGDAVVYKPSIDIKMPGKRVKPLSALLDGSGQAVAASHRQESIDFDDDDKVTPMKGVAK